MMLSAMMVRDPFDELSHSLDDRCRLIAMGRMTALLQFKHVHSRDRSRDAVDLFHSSVLVLLALDRENRAGDSWQILVDIPVAKVRVEPDVVPAPECGVRIGVVASQLVAQVPRLVASLGCFDAPD